MPMNETNETPPARGTAIRRALMIGAPILTVLAAIRVALWWGAESQHAMLRGRRWPPESLMVFLGR
jgi:hypothetical protein